MRPVPILTAAVVVVTMIAASACGTASTGGGGTALTYLTSFNTFGRDAYAYVAAEKGYFDEAGLDVDIRPGTGSLDVMKLVAGGRADFGTADFSAVAVGVAKDDIPVTSVAMVHQRTLAAILALGGSGIAAPADLAGRRVADQPGSTNQLLFPTYARKAGLDPATATFVPSTPPALPQLLASGQVDAIGQFVVGKGLIEAAAPGRSAVVLPYGEVLPDLYGNALVTSQDTARNRPDVVRAFTTALMRGLDYSIAHPEETGRILHDRQPTQQPAVAAAEVTAMRPYVTGNQQAPLGSVDRERVVRILDELRNAGAVTDSVTPDRIVDFALVPGAAS